MKAAPEDLTADFENEAGEIRGGRWGGMHGARYTPAPGTDLTPYFAAMPDGLCAGDHYGTVLEGELTVRVKGGAEETTRAGELYHWPAGHTGWTGPGVVFIAVTPLTQVDSMAEQMAAEAG
jgi:hypothetical protein